MLRNLYREFADDRRMSPVDRNRKSLADDWRLTINLSSAATSRGGETKDGTITWRPIDNRFGRINFDFVVDGPRDSGRIVYIEIPELKNHASQNRIEFMRDVKLGECYDMFGRMTELDICELISLCFVLPSVEDMIRHDELIVERNFRRNLELHKSEQYRNSIGYGKNGIYAIERRQLVFVTAKTQELRSDFSAKSQEMERQRKLIFMMQKMIRDAIENDTFGDLYIQAMKEMIEEEHEGDDTKLHLFEKALKREMTLTERRMKVLQTKLDAKIESMTGVTTNETNGAKTRSVKKKSQTEIPDRGTEITPIVNEYGYTMAVNKDGVKIVPRRPDPDESTSDMITSHQIVEPR